jgi:hypothetical protein
VINNPEVSQISLSSLTMTGDVSLSGVFPAEEYLDGVTDIQGDLSVENVDDLYTLGSLSLQSVGGTFSLLDSSVTNLAMGNLTAVNNVTFSQIQGIQDFGRISHSPI